MKPERVDRNLTPTSTAAVSFAEGLRGVVETFQMLQGHARGATFTVVPADGISRLPLSSTARLRMLTLPDFVGRKVYDHDERPRAGCHGPPSRETSTPATTPPPESVAVPAIVTGVPAVA